jgi:hypothetical protein
MEPSARSAGDEFVTRFIGWRHSLTPETVGTQPLASEPIKAIVERWSIERNDMDIARRIKNAASVAAPRWQTIARPGSRRRRQFDQRRARGNGGVKSGMTSRLFFR